MNTWAVVVPIAFFASAVATYAIHGALRDTDNMLARPHRLGRGTVHGSVISVYVYLLVLGELGGFLVLFTGAVKAQL